MSTNIFLLVLFLVCTFSFSCYGQQSCVIIDYEPVVCSNEPIEFILKTRGTCTIKDIKWIFNNTINNVDTFSGPGPHSVSFVDSKLTDFSINYNDFELGEHIDTLLSFKVIEPLKNISVEPRNPCIGQIIKLRAEGTNEGFFAWKGGQLDDFAKDQNLFEISDSIEFEQQNYNLKWYLGNTGKACSIKNFNYTVNSQKATPLTIEPSNKIDICEGDIVKLKIIDTNDKNNYTWESEDLFVSNTSLNIKPENSTNIIVSTVEDGCIRSENVTINVRNVPSFSIEPANAMICKGSSLRLSVIAADLDNEVSYRWTGGDIRPLNTYGNIVEITPEFNTTIYKASWEVGSCEASASSTITISENATEIIGDRTINICNGEAVDLTVNTPTKGVVKWYESSFPDAVEAPYITVSPEKTTTYEVEWTDGNCTDIGKITVIVNPKPVFDISSSIGYKVCEGEPINLQVNFTNGSFSENFGWSVEHVQDSLKIKNNQLSFSATQSTNITAVWLDTLNVCKEVVSEDIYINVLTKPREIFLSAGKEVLCEGENVILEVDETNSDNFILLRDADTGTNLDGKFTNGSIEILPEKTTNYLALWVNQECVIYSDTLKIVVNEMPDIEINNNKKVCPNSEFEINIQPNNYSVYLWSGGDIPPTDLVTGSKLSRGVEASSLVYSLRISNHNCILDTVVTVDLVDLNVNAVSDKPENEVCEGESALLSVDGADSYLWEENEILRGDLSRNPVALPTENFTQLKVQAYKEGCLVEDSIRLYLKERPVAIIREQATICFGDTVQLGGYGGQNYSWKPDLFLNDSETQNPVSTPEESIIYTLTVTAENSCTDEATVAINVNNDGCEIDLNKIFVPNTITPNGDNINDTWEIPAIADMQDYSVTIFTEFGTVIYNKTGYQNEFDGVKNGYLPEGTYYYIIKHLKSSSKKTGTLTIIR